MDSRPVSGYGTCLRGNDGGEVGDGGDAKVSGHGNGGYRGDFPNSVEPDY